MRHWRGLEGLGLFLLALVPCLAGSAACELVDVDEPRFAAATRGMLHGESWCVPHFAGEERLDKPILVYWLQALAMLVCGEHAFAARLPSALAIAGTAPLVADLARHFGASAAGARIAAMILPTTALGFGMAHAATADALLCLCTTLVAQAQIRGGRFLQLWLGLALAFLTKGPPALVGPLALAVALACAGRRAGWAWLLRGVLLAAAIVLAWGIPALVETQGRFLSVGIGKHVVARSLTPFEGHGGTGPLWWLFFALVTPIAFLPWTPWLLLARGPRVLWLWVAGTLLAFTLPASKLPHYVLPCFPALAILAVLGAERAAAPSPAWTRATAWLLRGTGCLVAALALPLFALGMPGAAVAMAVAGLCLALGHWRAGAALQAGRPAAALFAAAAGALFAITVLGARVLPAIAEHSLVRALLRELPAVVHAGDVLAVYREPLPSLVFHFAPSVRAIQDPGQAVAFLQQPGHRLLVAQRHLGDLAPGLQAAAGPAPAQQPAILLRCAGFHPNRGRRIEVVVLGRARP